MSLRVCIPAAGIGSRLGGETTYLNKSLVDVAAKPALARIIEMFPADAEFVIALGYKGELIREFLSLAYPDRKFLFAEVSPYDGPGAGPGLSLLQCEPFLQQPFIFITCDTLCREPIPLPDHNWAAWSESDDDLHLYRTLVLRDGNVHKVLEKGHLEPGCQAYIGMAGIFDYEQFWQGMKNPDAILQGEASGLRAILTAGKKMSAIKYDTWLDTGCIAGLERARREYSRTDAPTILPKPDEAIWFIGDQVIKFSDNRQFISQRVQRAAELSTIVPRITGFTSHMYAYKKADGVVLSRCITPLLFKKLLEQAREFWKPVNLNKADKADFNKRCHAFYKDKTMARVQKFYAAFQKKDSVTKINDRLLPPLKDILAAVDWDWLADGTPVRFHGDFHFENILWSERHKRFTFLDWRQNFAGDLHAGDIYYDFGKLLHGLLISQNLVAKDLYSVIWQDDVIKYDFMRSHSLICCEEILLNWLRQQGYSIKKTKIIASMIYLNIAALHHYPYCLILYAYGKDILYDQLGSADIEKYGYESKANE